YLSLLWVLLGAIRGICCPNDIEKRLVAPDRTQLFYQYWLPQGPVEKIILMCHGFQCHSDLYYVLGDYFYDKKVLVCAMDQRGHGRTSGIRGHLDSFDLVYQDMALLIHQLKRMYPKIPLYLMGESMGSLTILNFAAQNSKEIDGLIALVPGIRPRSFSALKNFFIFASFLKYIPIKKPIIKLPPDYDNPTYFPAFNDYDSHDLLHTNPISLGMILNLMNLFRTTLPFIKNKIQKPIFIAQGTGDKLLDPQGAFDLFRLIPTPDKTIRIYRDANHSLLMDQNALKIYTDIHSWLQTH
ncbi:MAG: alpha/beta hydrolase, partial [Candidatus Helarchaeota archaeon]|nr:alpha/beta hydrolase [Candidatus Helarchaeota archaeon]